MTINTYSCSGANTVSLRMKGLSSVHIVPLLSSGKTLAHLLIPVPSFLDAVMTFQCKQK